MYSVYLDDPDEREGPGELGLHGLPSIEDAQDAAEQHWGGPLIWQSATYGRVSKSNYDMRAYIIE